jgi:hypothetical protein
VDLHDRRRILSSGFAVSSITIFATQGLGVQPALPAAGLPSRGSLLPMRVLIIATMVVARVTATTTASTTPGAPQKQSIDPQQHPAQSSQLITGNCSSHRPHLTNGSVACQYWLLHPLLHNSSFQGSSNESNGALFALLARFQRSCRHGFPQAPCPSGALLSSGRA